MKVVELESVQGFIGMAFDGWTQGWHECHGGNLSYRIDADEMRQCDDFDVVNQQWVELEKELPNIANEFFAVTASGEFMRNIERKPNQVFGIIEVDALGKSYRKVWGFADGGKPTSELPVHLMNQSVKKATTCGKQRVVYHAHPANLTALTFILELKDEIFTRELWEVMPECAMTFPGGVGVLEWMVPGTLEIAKKTCEKMAEYDAVLWAQHGVFVSGDTFDKTFGLLHTLEKSAEIYLKTLNTGKERVVPSEKDLIEMAKVFNLQLPEKFLYSKM